MDTDPLLDLENKNYMYVPDEYLDSVKHKHRKPGKWSKFYFYRNRTKTEVSLDNIKSDFEITSSLEYQNRFLYYQAILKLHLVWNTNKIYFIN